MAAKFDPKAKAKRQKIIAGVLGLVLVGVLIFQAPTIMGMFGGGGSSTASEPAPTPTPTPAAPAPVTPGAPPPATPPAGGSATLVDTDPAPSPADGQLVAFDQFESKDPFVQQVDEKANGAGAAPKPSVPAEPVDKADNPEGEPKIEEERVSSPPAAAPRTATLAVNGAEQTVAVGGAFPEGDPMFKLVSVKRDSVKVGIAGGSYANGSQTITLRKGGKPVTLMNTADGTTYVLRLLSVG